MTECTWLSDRLPVLPADRAEWSAEDLRHLSGCESCRREWELVQATRHLGDWLLPPFDAVAVTTALRQRLHEVGLNRIRRIRAWAFAGVAAAAALAAVLLTGNGPDPLRRSEPVATGFRIPLPELDGLQPAELDSVLRTMDQPANSNPSSENDAPAELDNNLETVLESWEG